MKFKIYSKSDNNSDVIHFYDNITQDIWSEEGKLIDLRNDPKCKQLIYNPEEIRPFNYNLNENITSAKKSKKLNQLRITLGFNCNFSCKYCSQAQTRKVASTPKYVIHEDIDHKVAYLIDQLKKANLDPERIVFWGGEPLVYLKTIKKLLPELKKLYPNAIFGTITNGSLLTLNICKWLAENKISLTVSHDGPSFNVYRDDKNPLENPKVLEGIKWFLDNQDNHKLDFTFNIVVTPENANLQEIDEYFSSIFGKSVFFNFESIAKLDNYSKDIIKPFDKETTDVLINNIFAYGTTKDGEHPYASIRSKVSNVLKYLVNKSNMNKRPTYCNVASEDFIAIDMKGNLLECHGFSEIYGHISKLEESKFTIRHPWNTRENCFKCPYLVSCNGGCIMVSNEENKHSCRNLQIWHAGLFISAWKLLFNSTIYRIEPIMENENGNCN